MTCNIFQKFYRHEFPFMKSDLRDSAFLGFFFR
jgi:hypothetical protein